MASNFSLVSLGCPKNLVDSDTLTERLVNSGLSCLDNNENADILIINTCGFIEDAKKESIGEILKLAEIKKRTHVSVTVNSDSVGKKLTLKPDTDTNLPPQTHEHYPKLIVFGCLAKRYRDELLKEIPEIDAIFGVGEDERIVEYCEKIQVPSVSVSVNSVSVGKKLTLKTDTDTNLTPSPIHPFSSYVYLKIAEGCSRKCTYCVIPSIRGKYKSITPDEILKKAEGYINAGIKELILIAQDTASYGKDLNGYDIANLLKDLCSISGDFRIRFLYAYPASIKESLLNVIAEEEKICKYLDIPFQHSEDRILKLMKRGGSRNGYLNLIRKIRHIIPDIALRTTFIVGFPFETEEEFNSLIKFMEKAEFDRLGAFKYSKEEGTPAARLKRHLTEAIKNRRFDTIMRHQADISLNKNRALIGRRFKAVIDENSEGIAVGRLYSHAPEIDGVVIMEDTGFRIQDSRLRRVAEETGYNPPLSPLNKGGIKGGYHASLELKAGDFVTVEITDAFEYDLKGKIVK